MYRRLSLGLDSSTQGLTAVVADIETREVVYKKSLDYARDPRLNVFGINSDYILPPREEGEANQPPMMYAASLDAIFKDMVGELPLKNLGLADIAVINVSAQQHGHVFLGAGAEKLFASLQTAPSAGLTQLLDGIFSLPFARIWRTSNMGKEAEFVRRAVGGKDNLIRLSGSDAPLRFSAFGIRKSAREFPDEYRATSVIHQISSLIAAVLTGNARTPLDFGNACGTSLMDYTKRRWSPVLVEAVAQGLPGGEKGLMERLPALASGTTLVGAIAPYFVNKYGFSTGCRIGIGSGDNPQTKVLVSGSLLSLGSSFVIMVETDGATMDMEGNANAMYDALDRPFMFGCRTNGALRWDGLRDMYGIGKWDYVLAEKALKNTPAGNNGRLFLWQKEKESFPVSDILGPVRVGYETPNFAADYVGIVESTLAATYLHSRRLMTPGDTLYVTGGPASSPEVLRRVAAIWDRKVIAVEDAGAALGAAVSGAYALLGSEGRAHEPEKFAASFLNKRAPIMPRSDDVSAYHRADGWLSRFAQAETRLLE
jgi:xylulokinase